MIDAPQIDAAQLDAMNADELRTLAAKLFVRIDHDTREIHWRDAVRGRGATHRADTW